MILADVRDWLKTLNVAENYYCGRLENKKEKSLGVYNGASSGTPVMALGGLQNSSYDVKAVSLLLHWNRNSKETEKAAQVLWEHLITARSVDVSESEHIHFLQLTVPEPIAVGTDENGVYEYVINFNVIHKRIHPVDDPQN